MSGDISDVTTTMLLLVGTLGADMHVAASLIIRLLKFTTVSALHSCPHGSYTSGCLHP